MVKETVRAVSEWLVRIYREDDFGRNVATAAAGAIALATYLALRDWVIAALAIVITFPIARLVASELYDRRTRRSQVRLAKADAKRLYDHLSDEEKDVVRAFANEGGCVMTWAQARRHPITLPAIESLSERGLLRPDTTLDAMRETFVLDTALFDEEQRRRRGFVEGSVER